jgi:hypothetical protein
MDDFESRLEDELSRFGRTPLAEPVAVADLHRRARRVRVGRAVTGLVATATAIALVVGGLAIVGHDRAQRDTHLQVSAPNFLVGDVDAVVLSSTFDSDGARAPIPPYLLARVAAVPGVQSVSGVFDTFAPVTHEGEPSAPAVPPRSPILFSYHKDEDVHIVDGRAPADDDEIAVDADFLARNHVEVGDKVELNIRGVPRKFTVVGTFDLPGVDLTGIPMAAMSAAHQATDLYLDRIDVNIKPGASPASVREAITGAVGAHWTVVPPSTISFADQRLAQVEIQHAYWALLSPDANERSTSGVGASNSKEKQNYEKYSELAKQVELRVENVTFLSSEAAALTFRIFYGDSPSPIIHDPQTGAATRVDGHWQLATSTLCSLAALVGIKCDGDAANVPVTPPNGYETPRTLPQDARHAFSVLADPHSTTDERVAVLDGGVQVRDVVAAGVQSDQEVSKSDLTIAGWRSTGPERLEVLYSLQTTGGPSTPWPSTAIAQKNADGHWYALSRYACGIQGLASGGCYTAGPNPVPLGQTPVTAEAVPVRP